MGIFPGMASRSPRLLWNQLRAPRTRPHFSGSTHSRGCWFLPTVAGVSCRVQTASRGSRWGAGGVCLLHPLRRGWGPGSPGESPRALFFVSWDLPLELVPQGSQVLTVRP